MRGWHGHNLGTLNYISPRVIVVGISATVPRGTSGLFIRHPCFALVSLARICWICWVLGSGLLGSDLLIFCLGLRGNPPPAYFCRSGCSFRVPFFIHLFLSFFASFFVGFRELPGLIWEPFGLHFWLQNPTHF